MLKGLQLLSLIKGRKNTMRVGLMPAASTTCMHSYRYSTCRSVSTAFFFHRQAAPLYNSIGACTALSFYSTTGASSSSPLRSEERETKFFSGKVVRFDSHRGFGFIASDHNGEHFFFHRTSLQMEDDAEVAPPQVDGRVGPPREVEEGALVEFSLNRDELTGRMRCGEVYAPGLKKLPVPKGTARHGRGYPRIGADVRTQGQRKPDNL